MCYSDKFCKQYSSAQKKYIHFSGVVYVYKIVIKIELLQTNTTTTQTKQNFFSPCVFLRPTTSDENMNRVPPMDFLEVTLISALEIPSSFYPRGKRPLSDNSCIATSLLLHVYRDMKLTANISSSQHSLLFI